jgi:hypothetical protein
LRSLTSTRGVSANLAQGYASQVASPNPRQHQRLATTQPPPSREINSYKRGPGSNTCKVQGKVAIRFVRRLHPRILTSSFAFRVRYPGVACFFTSLLHATILFKDSFNVIIILLRSRSMRVPTCGHDQRMTGRKGSEDLCATDLSGTKMRRNRRLRTNLRVFDVALVTRYNVVRTILV